MAKGQKLRVGALSAAVLGLLTCSLSLVACGGAETSGGESGTGGTGTGTGGSSTGTGGSTGETGGSTGTGGATSGTGGSTTGSGGSSSADDLTYACLIPGEGQYSTCIQYTGSATYIDAIRDASNCVDQGGTELDECSPEGAGICVLSTEGLPTQNSQFYYGLTPDDVESYQAICEASSGTFTPPAP